MEAPEPPASALANPETSIMTIQIGDRLPTTTLVKATDSGPEAVNSDEFFKGRRVALFAVPGAFTPTCSARHLPGFVDKADVFKA